MNKINFKIENDVFDLTKYPTILVCGSTGCGKSYLLKKIWKQISTEYYNKVKFVFIDLKMVQYTNLIEANKLFPVCLETAKVDGILDELLNNTYDFPVVVFWDVFEDYLYLHNQALDKFKRLLTEGPKRKVYTITCSSRVAEPREYIDLFSAIFFGNWHEENFDAVFSDRIKDMIKESKIDYQELKTGEFILIQDNNAKLVRVTG